MLKVAKVDMPDPRFFTLEKALTIPEAARLAGLASATHAATDVALARVAALDEQDLEDAIVYVDDATKAAYLLGRRFGLCFAAPSAALSGERVIVCADPRAAFARVASALHRERPLFAGAARIAQDARIHASAVIGESAEIGPGADIGPHVTIGPGVVIGPNTRVRESASIRCALIGEGCEIGGGARIGGPGFGYVAGPAGAMRAPQLGRVLIGDHVEIGGNTTIDRGALGDTEIGARTKIDNLVQIAHNVRLGTDCLVAAQVGFAGSTTVGARVMFGGQAGIADHLTIGDDARVAAKAGVMRDIPAGESWGGYPARPVRQWLREAAAMAALTNKKRT